MGRLNSLLLAALVGCAACATEPRDAECREAFGAFVEKYGRSYATKAEHDARFEIFKKNFLYVQAENAKGKTYTLEINSFADQSVEEIKDGRLGLMAPPSLNALGALWKGMPHLGTDGYSGKDLPTSVDWVSKGAVTTPKNQGQCGSCWTFSTTGALEGAWQIATGNLVSLSEQQFVDCSHNGGNNGCNGGSMDNAFSFAETSPVCTEDSYPYKAAAGTCSASNCAAGIPKGKITGFKDVTPRDLNALMEAVAKQPVSVAIEADQTAFQLYKNGILSKECGSKLDHGVLLVGFGTENGTEYWKVKNSWGATWGEQGYIRMERGLSLDGECGIKLGAVYPVVASESEGAVIV